MDKNALQHGNTLPPIGTPCRVKRHLNHTHLKGYGGKDMQIVDTKKANVSAGFFCFYLDDTSRPQTLLTPPPESLQY
jgi:hypothetical protein